MLTHPHRHARTHARTCICAHHTTKDEVDMHLCICNGKSRSVWMHDRERARVDEACVRSRTHAGQVEACACAHKGAHTRGEGLACLGVAVCIRRPGEHIGRIVVGGRQREAESISQCTQRRLILERALAKCKVVALIARHAALLQPAAAQLIATPACIAWELTVEMCVGCADHAARCSDRHQVCCSTGFRACGLEPRPIFCISTYGLQKPLT